jgi:hypothetical protein
MNTRDTTDEERPSDACRLARHAIKGGLATTDAASGAPFASLVTVAFDHCGAPIMLLSELARHSANLAADGRAALLFDGTGGEREPLEGARVTYCGNVAPSGDAALIRRFLARHPDAAGYASFKDFSFYRMQVDMVHYVGGFGRIFTQPAAGILVEQTKADAFAEAEASILEHMNTDHLDAIALYAEKLLLAPAAQWQLTGCDADGCDLTSERLRHRLDFPARLEAPQSAREAFKQLSETARRR